MKYRIGGALILAAALLCAAAGCGGTALKHTRHLVAEICTDQRPFLFEEDGAPASPRCSPRRKRLHPLLQGGFGAHGLPPGLGHHHGHGNHHGSQGALRGPGHFPLGRTEIYPVLQSGGPALRGQPVKEKHGSDIRVFLCSFPPVPAPMI